MLDFPNRIGYTHNFRWFRSAENFALVSAFLNKFFIWQGDFTQKNLNRRFQNLEEKNIENRKLPENNVYSKLRLIDL